jgi:hypothetical protein
MKYIFLLLALIIPSLLVSQNLRLRNQYELKVEIFDTIVPAYKIRYHLSSTDKQQIGNDTIRMTRLFYIREDETKVYLRYREENYLTDNSKCYQGYYDVEIPCYYFSNQ